MKMDFKGNGYAHFHFKLLLPKQTKKEVIALACSKLIEAKIRLAKPRNALSEVSTTTTS